jgi:glucose-6-phosphate 1-dehydrogenase
MVVNKEIHPTTIVIFGATGDLTRRKLLPSLFSLWKQEMLPEEFRIIAFSRRPFTDQDYRRFATEEGNFSVAEKESLQFGKFLELISYVKGDFDDVSSYERLRDALAIFDTEWNHCSNKLLYLSVPPQSYELLIRNIKNSGLAIPCGGTLGWTRILVEKPFGSDGKSAYELDLMLRELYKEEQIFRIDHYLAKETLQNILAFRFSNTLFEPVWNRDYIESVHIRLFEKIGIEGRANLYEGVGALRDVGQNHALQMLALVAMENPMNLSEDHIRDERASVFKKLVLRPRSKLIRGQYEGFLAEKGIAADSVTETYFRIESAIEDVRWNGVPFIIESGKAMSEARADITVTFKNCDSVLTKEVDRLYGNRITFTLQPEEKIEIRFWAKKPGFEHSLREQLFTIQGGDTVAGPGAYERVLFDAIRGDQSLFAGTDEIRYSWKFVSAVQKKWKKTPLHTYKKGEDGPKNIG